jgi:hypothetical protein
MSQFLRDCGRGAVAGICATLPVTAVMILIHRRLPWYERYQLPPEKITGELADALDLEAVQTEPARTIATAVAHLGYGAGAGSVYGGTTGALNGNPVAGVTYGLAVWAGSYFGLMPALRLHEPATRHPWRRNAMMAAAHVVWGASLAAVLGRLNRSSARHRH